MTEQSEFYRGGQDHKVVTADNGAQVNSDYAAFVSTGPWANVKTHKVGEKIHAIVGYGLSNFTFIEGDTGLILIDTGPNIGAAYEALRMKAQFSDKPIVAIIYTHHHYTAGSQAILESHQGSDIPIYGHPDVDRNLFGLFSLTATGSFRRGHIQFGAHLPKEGPDAQLAIPEPTFEDAALNARGHVPVTHPISDGEEVIIDGVKVVFHHVVADTEDSLIIHLPELDAVVHNTAIMPFLFPMYTLRGDFYRAPQDVLASIDKVRALKPEHLIGCHGTPVSGRQQVYDLATKHRDALAFIFQQTVQGINRGLGPDEIALGLRLPPALEDDPELYPAYVDAEHIARGIYRGIIGWWANDPADLHPPSKEEMGAEVVTGFGGADALLERAQTILDEGRYNLAASLATYVLDTDAHHLNARRIKAKAMRKMAYATPTGIQTRNFMLTEALRLEGSIEFDETLGLAPDVLTTEMVAALPPETFLQSLTHTIDPDVAGDLTLTVRIDMTDIDRTFGLFIRSGAVEFRSEEPADQDLTLSFGSMQWARIATGQVKLITLLEEGDATLIGDQSAKNALLHAYAEVL